MCVPGAFGFTVGNGFVEGGGGLEINFPGFVFAGFGSDDGDEESINISGLDCLVLIELFEFIFGSL